MEITRNEAIWQIQKTVEEFSFFLQSKRMEIPYNHFDPDFVNLLLKADEFENSIKSIDSEKVLNSLSNEGLLEFYCLLQELVKSYKSYSSFTHIHREKITIIDKCQHKEGAMHVAEYIVNEIKTNCKSKIAESISHCNNFEERFIEWNKLDILQKILIEPPKPMRIEGILSWIAQVAPNKPWDHKPFIKDKFASYAVERLLDSGKKSLSHYHKYKNHDYFYDIWSNVHYGFVGMYCGFTEDELLDGAGLAQYISDTTNHIFKQTNKANPSTGVNGWRKFDTEADRISVQVGILLFKKYKENIEGLTGLLLLEELEKLNNIGNSRFVHICFDYTIENRTKD